MRATSWLRDELDIRRGGATRLASMEGLRGLAVGLVFLVHYTVLVGPWLSGTGAMHNLLFRIADAGNVGVDLFFVLSGFLIYGHLMEHEQDYRTFIARRARRIYPTFLVVFAVYLVLSGALPGESKLPTRPIEIPVFLLANALLIPGIVPIPAFITVAWSLSYEFFFYLTVPILITRARLRERTSEWRIRLFVRIGLGFLLLGGLISGTHPRMSMFFGGMVLWEWLKYRWPDRSQAPGAAARLDRSAVVALAVGVLAPLALQSNVVLGLPRIAVVLVAFTVLCAGCFAVDGRCRRWFTWTPLRLLGNVSFSFYLIHSLVLQGFFLGLEAVRAPTQDATWLWFALLPVLFLASAAAATAMFLLVEKPLSLNRRGLRPTGRRRQPG